MAEVFDSKLQKTKLLPWEDGDGRTWIQVVAAATLSANTPYLIIADEYGWIMKAFTGTAAERGYIGVLENAAVSGDVRRAQIGGRVTALITPSLSVAEGHALELHDGAVADEGSDYNMEANEFAVCVTASTTSTTQDVILIPVIHTTTT